MHAFSRENSMDCIKRQKDSAVLAFGVDSPHKGSVVGALQSCNKPVLWECQFCDMDIYFSPSDIPVVP